MPRRRTQSLPNSFSGYHQSVALNQQRLWEEAERARETLERAQQRQGTPTATRASRRLVEDQQARDQALADRWQEADNFEADQAAEQQRLQAEAQSFADYLEGRTPRTRRARRSWPGVHPIVQQGQHPGEVQVVVSREQELEEAVARRLEENQRVVEEAARQHQQEDSLF